MFTRGNKNTYVSIWDRFRKDQKGAVALMFSLSLIPLMLFVGAAIDYSRATSERERMQAALDSAALSLTSTEPTTSLIELQAMAEQVFLANYRNGRFGTNPQVTVTRVNSIISVAGVVDVDMAIMKFAGHSTWTVGASASVTAERKKIELALVLDNTGSMGSAGKMTALKAAVNDLVDALKKKVVQPDDVKLSIVPFNTEVKIDPGLFNASWLRWDVILENTSLSWAARQPPSQAAWQGCLADRDQPLDTNAAPATTLFTRYVASQCHASGLAQTEALTTNLELIRTRAQSMNPNGYTNVTIGMAMGLSTLRGDSPFGAASSNASNVEKFMIVLTDGDNTRNRWDSNSSAIDPRLELACNQAKTDAVDKRVKIFTIRVINGNAALLKKCASDPSMYYDVKDASELQPVFQKILDTIKGARITA